MDKTVQHTSPIISIIVPIYKAEAYLHRCIDSLLAQTFRDFELILVDDGSPDNSGKICDEYAAGDSRIKVYHVENGGVSAARQFGINHAHGEYSIHADPDDWVEPVMLEALYQKAVETDADMVVADFYVNEHDYSSEGITDSSARVLREALLHQRLHGFCWNKLIRRSCYHTYGVKFPVGINYSEDLLVCLQLLMHDGLRIAYLPEAFYHYDQTTNVNSISRRYTRHTYDLRCKFLNELKRYTQDYLPTQRNIVLEAILAGVLKKHEFYMVYGKDLERMWEDVRACNVRQRLPFWFLKKYLFRLARWMLLINNYLVRLHLTLRASQ